MAKSVSTTFIIAGIAIAGGLTLLIALLAGGDKKLPPPKPGDEPDDQPDDKPDDKPDEQPDEPPKPGETPTLEEIKAVPFTLPNVNIVDMRKNSPKDYTMYVRKPSAITTVMLHQMSCCTAWKPDNPLWDDVKAHFVVKHDGTVLMNHHPEERMKYGSGLANPFTITIEHQGNFPSADNKWYKPEKFGQDNLQDYPAQVQASRALLAGLKQRYPTIKFVYAHRQWDYPDRANCPGPQIWRASGEWAKKMLGLSDCLDEEGGVCKADHSPAGASIPASWRTPWP